MRLDSNFESCTGQKRSSMTQNKHNRGHLFPNRIIDTATGSGLPGNFSNQVISEDLTRARYKLQPELNQWTLACINYNHTPSMKLPMKTYPYKFYNHKPSKDVTNKDLSIYVTTTTQGMKLPMKMCLYKFFNHKPSKEVTNEDFPVYIKSTTPGMKLPMNTCLYTFYNHKPSKEVTNKDLSVYITTTTLGMKLPMKMCLIKLQPQFQPRSQQPWPITCVSAQPQLEQKPKAKSLICHFGNLQMHCGICSVHCPLLWNCLC